MTLNAIRVYPKTETVSSTVGDLQRLIAAEGIGILSDHSNCVAVLQKFVSNRSSAKQLGFILTTSNLWNVLDHVNDEGFGAIQINAAITDAARSSGLQLRVVRPLVLDLFSAIGMDKGKAIRCAEIEPGTLEASHNTVALPRKEVEVIQRRVVALRQTKKEQSTDEASEYHRLLTLLCNAGDELALYIRGMDYQNGSFGTEKNQTKAYQYLYQAHKAGNPDASQLLGNSAYDNRSYTEAYEYLTAPGAVPINGVGRKNITQIHQQKRLNFWNLFFSGGLLLLFIAFIAAFNSGLFSGESLTGAAITLSIIAFLFFVGGSVFTKLKPFNNNRWSVFWIFLCWAIYTIILLVN